MPSIGWNQSDGLKGETIKNSSSAKRRRLQNKSHLVHIYIGAHRLHAHCASIACKVRASLLLPVFVNGRNNSEYLYVDLQRAKYDGAVARASQLASSAV